MCVHNAGRSQMAEAFAREIARERGLDIEAESAGTLGGGTLNPVAVAAMREVGIEMGDARPKALTPEMVARADRIVSMGCGVDAEACPVRFMITEDWALDDPAGRGIEAVRPIRDAIRARVEALLS